MNYNKIGNAYILITQAPQRHQFLVVVDSISKWQKVMLEMLSNMFARIGLFVMLLDVMLSDNATIFKTSLYNFASTLVFLYKKLIVPGYLATNGLTERNVQP